MKEAVKVSEMIKVIPGFSNYLADLENGLIYSKNSHKWLNPRPNDVGYVYTNLINDIGEVKVISVHSLIMSAAIESEPSFWLTKNLEIDHRDRNKANNEFANLHLVTKKKNFENVNYVNRKPKKHLTEDEVRFIKDALLETFQTIHRVRRRFINLFVSVLFMMLCYVYFYSIMIPKHFALENSESNNIMISFIYAIAQSFAVDYEGMKSVSSIGATIEITQVLNMFIFISILLAKSLPKANQE